MYRPKSTKEINSILKDIFENKNDSLKPLREKIIKEKFFMPENGVGKYIADYIRNSIGMS